MRIKKIRGHKRLWKHIEQWRKANLQLDIEKLKTQHRDYVKIWIHPFSSISVLNCEFPEPKGKTRQLILAGLVDIYHAWKTKLDALDEPYYLKIWLYEPNLSRSQVVCALGSALNFYDNTFYKPEITDLKKIQNTRATLPSGFNWEKHFDELHINESDIGEAEDYFSLEDYYAQKNWFAKKMKMPHRSSVYENLDGTKTEYYSFKTGIVWIGEMS